jgi:hypothetical protein
MISRASVQLIAAIALCLIPSVSESYVLKGRPSCPWYSPGHTWSDFLQGKYGDGYPLFSIRFDHAKAAFGGLKPNTCYAVSYDSGRWITTNRDDTGRTSPPPSYGGGDPAQKEMNIKGRIMKFNEGGQVFDQEFGLVGTLKCGIGPDC